MDGNASYPLVPLLPEQGALVSVVDAEPHEDDDGSLLRYWLVRLWQCFSQLALLFWLACQTIRYLQGQLLELRRRAHYWQALHQKARQREAALAARVRHLQAEIRELKRRLFGRKSETSATTQQTTTKPPDSSEPRSRGQQRGSRGHGRRNHDHLPTTHETCDLPETQKCCPDCGLPYEEIPGTIDGNILEIEVRAYRRRYQRKRYRRPCDCGNRPRLLTAPPPDKLIPKSNIGISVWTTILEHKFAFFQPLHRTLAELSSNDMSLPAGTITDGMHKLVPLFEPLYKLLAEHNRAADRWHCDETRWLVFEKQPKKANFKWMLWVFAAKDSIVFVLDPTRSHDVPEGHFGDDAEGVANVDRYSSYKAMAQVKAGKILLAFCWAHVRRDFLTVLTGWTELTDWAWSWLEDIGLLYRHNDQRLAVREDNSQFAAADQQVRAQVEHLRLRCEAELADPDLRQPHRKVLTSLQEHWSGLTVFVDRPEVPMDNNEAERRLRGPVVARKNFYGSGALWSGRLAAMLFSLFQTVQAWGLVIGKWLTVYLTDCAIAGGQPPPNLQRYLPWNMSAKERDRLGPAKAETPEPPDSAAPNPDNTETAA